MRQVDDTFDEFLASSDNVKVVYFCKGTCQNLGLLGSPRIRYH